MNQLILFLDGFILRYYEFKFEVFCTSAKIKRY
jgi:hypothetical protein